MALAICQAILNNTVKYVSLSLSPPKDKNSLHKTFRAQLQNDSFPQDLIDSITSSPTTYYTLNLTPSQVIAVQDAFSNGVQNVFRFCFPCAIVSFFVSVLMIEQHSLKRGDEDQLKAKGQQWAEKHSHKRDERSEQPPGELPNSESPAQEQPQPPAVIPAATDPEKTTPTAPPQ